MTRRGSIIEGLHTVLSTCQEDLRDRISGVLYSVATELRDVAYANDGDIDHMLQREVLQHNTKALANARAVEQVIAQLQVSEVRLQKHVRSEYKRAEADWRQLRTKHMIGTFVDAVRNTDCAVPSKCSTLIGDMKAAQQRNAAVVSECIVDDMLCPEHVQSPEACCKYAPPYECPDAYACTWSFVAATLSDSNPCTVVLNYRESAEH